MKVGCGSEASSTRIDGGRMSFRAFTNWLAVWAIQIAKVATWPRACTPASVRPEPCGKTFSPVTRPIAEARGPGLSAHPAVFASQNKLRAVICQKEPEIAHEDRPELAPQLRENSFRVLAKLMQPAVLRLSRGACVSYTVAFHSAVDMKCGALPTKHTGYTKNETWARCFA